MANDNNIKPNNHKMTTQSNNEDEKVMIDILFQLERMRENQREFKTAIIDFVEDMIQDLSPDDTE